jgi:hypothetical protein
MLRAGALDKRNVRESRSSRRAHHGGERARLRVSRCGPLAEKVADCRQRTLDDGEENLKWRPVASNDLASVLMCSTT